MGWCEKIFERYHGMVSIMGGATVVIPYYTHNISTIIILDYNTSKIIILVTHYKYYSTSNIVIL